MSPSLNVKPLYKEKLMEIIASRGVITPKGKKKTADEIEKMRQDANRTVKGVFRCHEPRGGEVTLVWKEYKGDPIRRWTLRDGQEYELPIGLAKHLNKNCCYSVHGHILGPDGNPLVDKQNKSVSRMNFESMEFYG